MKGLPNHALITHSNLLCMARSCYTL